MGIECKAISLREKELLLEEFNSKDVSKSSAPIVVRLWKNKKGNF
jgi:hypothetical protein